MDKALKGAILIKAVEQAKQYMVEKEPTMSREAFKIKAGDFAVILFDECEASEQEFRRFMAKTLEHAMTTRRTPSFRERALQISKSLGLTRTCAALERSLYKSKP